jgi:superfamily I DNA/RNA helicase
VGATIAARITVSNYHSFCQQVLTDRAAEAGLPPHPDVIDGIGQLLLLKDLRQELGIVYHPMPYALGEFVKFISRCKDELITPADFDAFVASERAIFEDRYGTYADAAAHLATAGYPKPFREVRKEYAHLRTTERADAPEEEVDTAERGLEKAADREARRMVGATGPARRRGPFEAEQQPQIDELAASYLKDGAALEVMRLTELASVYHGYEEELARRGALDFGEQVAAVTRLFKQRPNILRRWQRQYRYILVDEFQDANIAHAGPAGQRHGGGGRRPVDLPLPRCQLRCLLGVRQALQPTAQACARRASSRPASTPAGTRSIASMAASTAPAPPAAATPYRKARRLNRR